MTYALDAVFASKLAFFTYLTWRRRWDAMVVGHARSVVAIFFVRAINALRLAVASKEFGQADCVIIAQKLKI
jgi:hypothetical protein